MPRPPHPRGLATELVHAGERRSASSARPIATPVHTAVTFLHPSAAELDAAFASGAAPVYTRYGNPTLAQLESALALADGGAGAVAYASGMAALHAAVLVAGTPRGETRPANAGILASRELYGASTHLLEDLFAARGAPLHYGDPTDLEGFGRTLREVRPGVVVVEQLSNPLLRVVDVAALAALTHEVGGRLVVDSTIASPVLERPLAVGADLVVHSATKFLGGHGDVLGGAVIARTNLVADALRLQARLLGATLGPFEANLVARGMKTLCLRVRRQCESAAQVAAYLEGRKDVARVHYPGLHSHADHALASRVFGGLYGALISFELTGGREPAMHLLDSLRLVLPATSLGDVYSLASLPIISSHRDLTAEQRAERNIPDGLVRLSIGIEDAADLIADLADALDAVAAA